MPGVEHAELVLGCEDILDAIVEAVISDAGVGAEVNCSVLAPVLLEGNPSSSAVVSDLRRTPSQSTAPLSCLWIVVAITLVS